MILRAPPASHPALGHLAAVSVVIIVTVIKLVSPGLGNEAPFVLYAAAVAVAAYYGGFWPGMLATALSSVAATLFFLNPDHGVQTGEEIAALAAGNFSGALISYLIGRRLNELRVAGQQSATFLAVLRSVSDPIYSLDKKGRFVYVNPAFARLFGYPKPSLIGQTFEMLSPPEARVAARKRLDGYVAGVHEPGSWPDAVSEALRSDGRRLRITSSVTEYITTDGVLFTGVIHSIQEVDGNGQTREEAAHGQPIRQGRPGASPDKTAETHFD